MCNELNNNSERFNKKITKEREMHKANILKDEDLAVLQDYLYHNRSMRNSIFWKLPRCKESRAMMENQYAWKPTVICHKGIEYKFEITAECEAYLKVYRKVYRNGKKTNSRVLRTLVEKHFAAVEYLTKSGISLPSISLNMPTYISDCRQRRFFACSAVKSISAAFCLSYPPNRQQTIRGYRREAGVLGNDMIKQELIDLLA